MIIFINVFFSTYLLNAQCLPGVLTGTEVVPGSKIKILALMGLHMYSGRCGKQKGGRYTRNHNIR